MSLNVVILAAGQGKRMHSALPKVLHRLAGKPLVRHVINAARALNPATIVVVYGHGGEAVREAMAGPGIAFAKQEPQLGTGHAVLQAVPLLGNAETTLILYGDVPLTSITTLKALVAAAHKEAGERGMAILTVALDDPSGYGRMVRENGTIMRIVEGWPRNFSARRAAELGFQAEASFDEIIRIHIEDELGGRFAA